MSTTELLTGVLDSIQRGERRIVPEECPQEVYAGNVTYVTNDGWRIVVFNDCNAWDYVDYMENPEGKRFEVFPTNAKLGDDGAFFWAPEDPKTWWIPGYMDHFEKCPCPVCCQAGPPSPSASPR